MRQLIASFLMCSSLLVAGCSNTRPLYGTGADGKGVAVALSGITVEDQKTRAGQIVRNNLVSSFGIAGSSNYILRLVPEEKTQQVSSVSTQKLERQRYRLSVKYELATAQNGSTVATGTSFSNVSFDTVEQPIADLRAAENARERAAREVAEDIRLRLAAHFSAGN
jgi:LPS-assembly lipoprotein